MFTPHNRTIAACLLMLTCTLPLGCGAAQRAAAKDPLRCERDPNCKDKDRSKDCSLQCADDPACVDRCREINLTTGAIAR